MLEADEGLKCLQHGSLKIESQDALAICHGLEKIAKLLCQMESPWLFPVCLANLFLELRLTNGVCKIGNS